jgi:hypothetical protein
MSKAKTRTSNKAKAQPAGKAKVRAERKAKQKAVDRYVTSIPVAVPDGLILVHNDVRPAHPIGRNGFRVWLTTPAKQYIPCDCGWAAEVPGGHYRVLIKN